jgi:hypothetical protein
MNPAESTVMDYYEVLQISPNASPEVIEAAYRGLSKKYGADPDPAVRESRRLLDQAFGVLSDPGRRAEYDRSRLADPVPAVVVPPAPAAPVYPRTGVVLCPRDPGIETALRCSRCETPICPKCLVQTPVGARCRDCARMSKSPVYTVQGAALARAIAAAVIGGVAMGLIWGFASQRVIGLAYGIGLATIFLGIGLGYAFSRIMEFATNRKRGPVIVSCAMGGILLATSIQVLMVGGNIFVGSILAAGIGLYFAYQNLR